MSVEKWSNDDSNKDWELGQVLPDFMVPAVFMLLKQVPLSPNGKVDRRALPVPEVHLSVAFRAPHTETEARIADIWAETLHREQVGVDDSFLELGGHSLHAAQIISRVREAFSVVLPLRSIFDAPTVAQIARVVEQQPELAQPAGAPPLVALPRELRGTKNPG